MKVILARGTDAEIVLGEGLEQLPRWGLRSNSLMMGPYHSGLEHEQHYLATTGSGDWYRSEDDEFRFDSEQLTLRSIWFHVADRNLLAPEFLSRCFDTPPVEGSLRLINRHHFSAAPVTHRSFDPNGRVLAGLHLPVAGTGSEILRLRITTDFDLVFSDTRIAGWFLWNPLRYLTSGWADPADAGEPDVGLAAQVSRYLELVSDSNYLAMEKKDPTYLKSLIDLHSQVAGADDDNPRRNIVRKSIEQVIENFYGPLEKNRLGTNKSTRPN